MSTLKKCKRCRRIKPAGAFNTCGSASRTPRLRRGVCKPCENRRRIQFKLARPEVYRAHSKRTHSATRAWINEQKQKPCADCGVTYPHWVMDFDHVRGTKRFSLGAAARYFTNRCKIAHEIKKCDVVCSNCHRQRTHDNRANHGRHPTQAEPERTHLEGCRCAEYATRGRFREEWCDTTKPDRRGVLK